MNKDTKRRAELLGIDTGKFVHFVGLTAVNLRKLIDEGFADPEEQQNDAPSIREFIEYMEAHPGLTAHGYAVGLERPDYRVSIEGLKGVVASAEEALDFEHWCRRADELESALADDGYHCSSWWD
jgi:hypothetical protein